MKNLKELVLALSVVAGVVGLRAEVLYWQVASADGVTFTTANLYVEGVTDPISANNLADDYDSSTGVGTKLGVTQTDITSYANSSYSFFVELVTYSNGGQVTDTQRMPTWSYDDLLSAGYVAGNGLTDGATASANALAGGGLGVNPVPEPTSGLLLLIGGSLLALRRRRR